MNEWSNHPGAEFMEIEIRSGKTFFLTVEQVKERYDITDDEIDQMTKMSDKKQTMNLVNSNGFLLIRK